jgi:hypothetical protein
MLKSILILFAILHLTSSTKIGDNGTELFHEFREDNEVDKAVEKTGSKKYFLATNFYFKIAF